MMGLFNLLSLHILTIITTMNRSVLGKQRFEYGMNCAQSVFSALLTDNDIDQDIAFRIASAFGGGIVDTGKTCGAITGALMVLGLRYGHTSPFEAGEKALLKLKATQFLDSFKKEFGSLECDILKDRFLNPADTHDNCKIYVARAIEIVEDIVSG
jgi:C_GCAxxG_C_C family probable redox protein